MREGRRVSEYTRLDTARQRFATDLAALPPGACTISAPVAPKAELSDLLSSLAARVRRYIKKNLIGDTDEVI